MKLKKLSDTCMTDFPHFQLPFSSTPAERQVLGSLASQDNVRQQPVSVHISCVYCIVASFSRFFFFFFRVPTGDKIVFRGAAGAPRKGVIYTSPLSAKPPNTTSPPTMPSGGTLVLQCRYALCTYQLRVYISLQNCCFESVEGFCILCERE